MSTQVSTVYRRQTCDVACQTDPIIIPSNNAYGQGNQPQTLGFTKTSSKSRNKFNSKSKSKTNSNSISKSNTKSTHSNSKSFTISENQQVNQILDSNEITISTLNIPPDQLLHCKFHIEGQPITLLVDTGAAISVLHSDKLGKSKLNTAHKVSIVGVSSKNNSIRTHGTAEVKLDNFCKHKFHIANLNIEADGILGLDFMSKANVNIYITSKTMHVGNRRYKLFHLGEQDTIIDNKQLVNRRSETVITCFTNDITTGTAIIDKQQIFKGLTIPHALVNVVNNKFLITCVNTLDEDKTISIPTVQSTIFNEPINENNNIPINTTNRLNSTDRRNEVHKLIRRDHLNAEENNSLNKIIDQFPDIFYIEGDPLTFTNHTKHPIPTTNEMPIHTKTYRFPQIHEQEVKTQVQKLLDQNIIRPSSSPWTSPIWIVPKKIDASGKKKWRMVIDYRKLNEITIGDSYPLPNITDILDKLGHSIYFSTLDLASGFHQIELDSKAIPKSAFTTPYGHYEFLRMPFGLKNAPATFQRVMDSILIGLQGERCFVYLDDIVVFASSLQEHEEKLREVFTRLQEFELKIQPDKCEFLRNEVAYLGHIISSEGVKPNPDKVEAVQNFPVPKCCKDIKAFLGLTGYYRRFISNFSKITKPLTSLLKKDVPFIWGEAQQKAFNECKNLLTNPPILQYPNFNKEFVLTTDASLYAIGSVLSQGEIGKDLPIAYASRTLNKAESNYSTIERELLAIVWAVKHFRPYLFGRKFKIVTDHKPLTWLFSVKDPGSRLVRWRLKLEEFEYEIIYKAGKINTNADALSRPPILAVNNTSESIMLQTNYEHYISNPYTTYDTHKLTFSPNNIFDKRHKNILIPISSALSENNNLSVEAINLCSQVQTYLEKTKELYQVDFLCSNLKQNIFLGVTRPSHYDPWDIESYFKVLLNCLQSHKLDTLYIPDLKNDRTCKMQGDQQKYVTAYLADVYDVNIVICENRVSTPDRALIPEILKQYHDEPLAGHRGVVETNRKIREDFFWKGMTEEIKKYVDSCLTCQRNKILRKTYKAPMVITGQSTEPFERVSMDLVSYSDISENSNRYILTLQDELTRFVQAYPIPDKEAITVAKQLLVFCQHYGVPRRFHSDQGSEFMNNVLKQLIKFLGSKQTFNTAYHPQSNGALERFHATLRDHIRMYQNRNLKNWDLIIPFAIMCHNTSVNQSTGFTPHELLFGYKPRPFYTMKEFNEYTANDYLKDLNERLRIARETANSNIENMKEKAKTRYDNTIRNLARFNLGSKVMLKVPNPNNLESKWEGPYEIIRIGFNENYIIRKAGRNYTVHANRLKPYS